MASANHDRTVGRIYRMRSTGRELRRRTQIRITDAAASGCGGVADTLAEAKAAFRRTWDGVCPRSNEELHEWLERRRAQ
jgi:hypothetical protein